MEITMGKKIVETYVTDSQVAHWKAQFGEGNVKEMSVPVSDPTVEIRKDDFGKDMEVIIPPPSVTGYFRKPDLKIIQAAAPYLESDPIKAGLIQFENCWLGGDPEFLHNGEVKVSAIHALNTLFRVRAATIKNA